MAQYETKAGARLENSNGQNEKKGRKTTPRLATFAGNAVFGLLLLVVCFLAFCLLQSRISGAEPTVAGHRLYVVLSDSMAPAFRAGSMIAVRPTEAASLKTGDIITFIDPGSGAGSITHRIAAVHTGDELTFTTRGDANDCDDREPVPAGNIIGKLVLALPYAGYLVTWSRTKVGLIILVIMPGLLIIALELKNLLRYTGGKKAKRQEAAAEPENEDQ